MVLRNTHIYPDSKVHGANMGPTWVLSAQDGPHVGPMNLAIRVHIHFCDPRKLPFKTQWKGPEYIATVITTRLELSQGYSQAIHLHKRVNYTDINEAQSYWGNIHDTKQMVTSTIDLLQKWIKCVDGLWIISCTLKSGVKTKTKQRSWSRKQLLLHSKCIWKYLLRNSGHFVQSEMS